MIQAQALLASRSVAGSNADNAVSTATVPAIANQHNYLLGVSADYSATVSAIKTITVTYTRDGSSTTYIVRWDFSNGAFPFSLPGVLKGDHSSAITVALEASGTGGTSGRVYAFYFTS